MFSVTVDNVEYKVEFRHYNPTVFPNRSVWQYGTDCFIHEGESDLVAKGETNLHPLDLNSYNKDVGRKLSLHRALRLAFSGDESKEIRRKFWQAYYQARGEKW